MTRRLACAMSLAALAKSASAFPKRAVHSCAGILKNRDCPNQQAGEKCESESKEQYRQVDADLVDSRQTGRRNGHQNSNRSIGDCQANQAACQSEYEALEQQFLGEATPAGAER